ncbi:DUF4262 domain-containing protein [Couchioplanes caeruleus]|uniref:DUF4262 domain-containing protein n=1 Tax=Couchioplanes caeruleus TaxID=56438 RepID=UPI00373FDD2C
MGIWHTLRSPEVCVFGLPAETAMSIVNVVGDLLRDGERLSDGQPHRHRCGEGTPERRYPARTAVSRRFGLPRMRPASPGCRHRYGRAGTFFSEERQHLLESLSAVDACVRPREVDTSRHQIGEAFRLAAMTARAGRRHSRRT